MSLSVEPSSSGRLLVKKRRCPSTDKLGPASPLELLTTGPRFTGVSQGHARQARCDTHMSLPPSAPGRSVRFETKYRLSSSLDRVGFCSTAGELTGGPRFNGSDQGDPCALELARIRALGASTVSRESVPQAASTAV